MLQKKKVLLGFGKDGLVTVQRILNYQVYFQEQNVLKFLYHLFD